MKKLRVVVLMHTDLVPPDDLAGHTEAEIGKWKTEYDVVCAIENLGHEVLKLGVDDELRPIRQAISRFKPDLFFMLLEEFRGEAVFDQHVVGYLELLGMPYTGCNPRGLVLTRGKALSKKILSYHRIPAPGFAVFPQGRKVKRPAKLPFPLFVKSASEDASLGISQSSIVHDDESLVERVEFVHERVGSNAIAEQFIDGRDVYVGVMGNDRLRVLTPQELVMKKRPSEMPMIATAKVKHDVNYQKKWGIDVRKASLDAATEKRIVQTSRRIYRALHLDGYARIDYRVDSNGQAWFLEANANPDLARYEEFANAAEQSGIEYEKLIQSILALGLARGRG